MKTIIFKQEINLTNVTNLIHLIDNTMMENIEKGMMLPIELYFSATGHNQTAKTLLIEYLNSVVNIKIMAFNEIYGDGIEIFFKVWATEKKVLQWTKGIITLPEDKEEQKLFLSWVDIMGLPEKSKKKIKTGLELNYLDLQTILTNKEEDLKITYD